MGIDVYEQIPVMESEKFLLREIEDSLMDLIRCNAVNPNNCKWITLTYRKEMRYLTPKITSFGFYVSVSRKTKSNQLWKVDSIKYSLKRVKN